MQDEIAALRGLLRGSARRLSRQATGPHAASDQVGLAPSKPSLWQQFRCKRPISAQISTSVIVNAVDGQLQNAFQTELLFALQRPPIV